MRGAGEELRLKLGAGGDNVAAGAIQNFRMAAEGAGCGARRVQKDRVEFLARLPDKRVRLDELIDVDRTSLYDALDDLNE